MAAALFKCTISSSWKEEDALGSSSLPAYASSQSRTKLCSARFNVCCSFSFFRLDDGLTTLRLLSILFTSKISHYASSHATALLEKSLSIIAFFARELLHDVVSLPDELTTRARAPPAY